MRSPDLVKIRWKGPATVLMREEDESGKPKIYWIAYKSQLLRAAPHLVPPEIGKSTSNMMGNFEDAKEVIKSLKPRGFADLTIQNQRNSYDMDTDEEVLDDLESNWEPPTQRRRLFDPNFTRASPAPSLVYSPSVGPDPAELDLDDAPGPPPDRTPSCSSSCRVAWTYARPGCWSSCCSHWT